MGWLSIFNRNNTNTASIAKDRLTILLGTGGDGSTSDFLPKLQREILEVVRKYIQIDESQINITREKGSDCEVLVLNLPMPERPKAEVASPSEQRHHAKPQPIRNARPVGGPDGRKPF